MYKSRAASFNVSLLNVRIIFLSLAFLHLVVTAFVTLNIDTTVDEDPKVRAYYYVRWRLITCWFNLITLAYLPARLIADWRTSQGDGDTALVTQLKHFSDVLMTGILFPIVLYSDLFFWGIYTTDPALLGPPRVFDYLPPWAQHSLHTVSYLVVLGDLILTPRRRPNSLKPRFALLLTFSLTYIAMMLFNRFKGESVYWVTDEMTLTQFIVSASASVVVVIMLFAVQWIAIDYRWKFTQIEKKIS